MRRDRVELSRSEESLCRGCGVLVYFLLSKSDETLHLFGLLLEEGDQVVAVLGLLETTEGHLCAGNVLLGVLEVLEL